MELQNNLPQVIDFQMQHDGTSVQQNLVAWLNQQNQLLNDTCDESLQCCKRDWLNEKGESSRVNQNSSVSDQCGPSNVTDRTYKITGNQNNGPNYDQYIPYIELDSDNDEEFIDLTDAHDEIHQRSVDHSDLNGGMLASLLSSYNILDIPSQSSNQVNTECINVDCNDDIISLGTDSDILSVHVDSSNEVINEEQNSTIDVEQNNISNNNDEMITSDGGMCTSILSAVNIVDTEDDISVENGKRTLNLNDHSFTSMLSPFSVSNNIEDTKIETNSEKLSDTNVTDDVCNSLLSTVSVADTENCDVDLTAEKSHKKKRKRNKKKKRNPPPPHIIKKIIESKRDKKFWKSLAYKIEEKKQINIKKEDIKDECKKQNVCQEISPAITEASSISRTLATQTVNVFRIAIKDETTEIKQEKRD